MLNLDQIKPKVEELCLQVGSYQLEKFRSATLEVDHKDTACDLVTEVDKKSEKMIVDFINNSFPDHGILAEESGLHETQSPYQWIVDPLDGTNNYARGLPIFAISIALSYKNELLLGAIYAPYLNDMYTAIKGQGAYCGKQRLSVSSREELATSIIGTGFPYDKATHPVNNIDYFSNLIPKLGGARRMGACAYDLCMVAAGHLDGYWELNLGPWDVAAGELLVTEAGGQVLHFRQDRKISIIAGSRSMVDNIWQEHKKVSPEISL